MFPSARKRQTSPAVSQFLRRATGLDLTHRRAYTRLIDSLVADGIWSKLDQLCIYATDTSAHALLNLKGTSFVPTLVNAPTFTADQGFAGNGTSSYIQSNYQPSTAGGQLTQNSASVGVYNRTSRTSDAATSLFGVTDAASNSLKRLLLIPKTTTDIAIYDINSAPIADTVTNANAQGQYILTRTGANTVVVYKNGSSIDTSAGASDGLADQVLVFGALRQGFGALVTYSTDQIAASFIGGGLNATEAGTISSRINTYMTALGTNVY